MLKPNKKQAMQTVNEHNNRVIVHFYFIFKINKMVLQCCQMIALAILDLQCKNFQLLYCESIQGAFWMKYEASTVSLLHRT